MRKNKNLKKLVIFAITAFMILSAISLTANAATGDNCSTPITFSISPAAPGTYLWGDYGQYTCGRVDDYSDTPLGYYDGGEDIIYEIYVTASMSIDIWFYSADSWNGLMINSVCGDTTNPAIVVSTSSSSGSRWINGVNFPSAGYYYMMIDTWPSPDCITYFEVEFYAGTGPSPGDTCATALDAYAGLNYASHQPIWYHYTPSVDCTLEITSNNLPPQMVDTQLYVYDACGGTQVAYADDDYSGYYNYASTVQFTAYAGIDYKMHWTDYWSTSDFYFYITEITGCDVGVTSILHPINGDGPGAITPEVYVADFLGSGTTTDVYMDIFEGPLGAEILFEDFEGSWPPAGWTTVNYGGNCVWLRNDYWPRTNYCNGVYSADADSDACGSGTTMDTGLLTPTFSLAATTAPMLEYECAFNYLGSTGEYADVDISTNGGSTWTNLQHLTADVGAYGSVLQTISLAAYAGQTNCMLRFHYYAPGWDWWWEVDDVHIYQPGATIPVYSGSVLGFSAPGYAIFPSWTPLASGLYSVRAWTDASCDVEPANDMMEVSMLMIGTIDAGVDIVFPTALMGPIPFSPVGNVTNYGDLDLPACPVHAWIDVIPQLVFYEDFETLGALNTPDIPAKTIADEPKDGGEAAVKIEWQGESGVGDVNDWTVYNYGDLSSYWHWTTNRYVSPIHSMQAADPLTGLAGTGDDWLISPAINVGIGGYLELDLWKQYYEYSGGYQRVFIGNSADGSSFYGSWHYYEPDEVWTHITQGLYPSYIAADGTTYIGLLFRASYSGYEGAYVDNVQVWSGGTVYDETIAVSVDAGTYTDAVFPTFAPDEDTNYAINMCTEQPYDENPTNDCDALAFYTGAPVYILETGAGFATIQEAIDAAEDGQTVIATDGTYYENIIIDKPITVTGEHIQSTQDKDTCTWEHDHSTFLVGTVEIQGQTGGGTGPGPGPGWDMIEDFEMGSGWPWSPWNGIVAIGDASDGADIPGGVGATEGVGTQAAHDGSYGFYSTGMGPYWFYRTDVSIGNPGDKLSWWNKFTPNADGRSYLGFGATPAGCLSFVLAPNTGELKLYDDAGWGYSTLYTTGQSFIADHWYRAEVVFDSTTQVTCNLYDEDGTTLLNTFTYSGLSGLPGGVAFRAYGVDPNYVYADTIETTSTSMTGPDDETGYTIFQKFDVTPGFTFTDQDAAVMIYGGKVIVRQNTIHNVRGLVDATSGPFTIKGVHAYGGPNSTGESIYIENNTIRDIVNQNVTYAPIKIHQLGPEDFEGTYGIRPLPPPGWTVEDYDGDGYFSGVYAYNMWGSYYSSSYAHSGTMSMRSEDNGATPCVDFLWTDAVSLDPGIDYTLDFWYRVSSSSTSYDTNYEIYLSTIPNNAGIMQFIGGEYTILNTVHAQAQHTFQLMGSSGTYYIGILRYGGYSYADLFIDDVDLYYLQSPPIVYGGADAIMVQGYLRDVTVMDNRLEDVHSKGWCYGVEVTPTASGALDGRFAPVDFYLEDFSTCPGGWTITDPAGDGCTWECATVQPSWIITPMGPVSGTFMMVDDDSCDGDNYAEELISPVINCGDYENIFLDFDGCFNSVYTGSSGYDFLNVEVYDGSWHQLTYYPGGPHTFEDDIGFGSVSAFDVSAYADHNSNFQIKFVFGDAASWAWGAIIDNVKLTGDETGGGGGGSGFGPEPRNVIVNCNYFRGIGDGTVFDINWNLTGAPYPGIMFTVDTYGQMPANASQITLKCNYFDNECYDLIYAVINKDIFHPLDATLNYWGKADGPNSCPITGPVIDPMTGLIADGRGCEILNVGQVMFDPWLGIHAEIVEPMGDTVTVEAGQPLRFDASCPEGSFAYCFPTCDECCEPEYQELQYLWDFDDGLLSANKVAIHVFDQPGTYYVSLMVDTFGFPYHNNFMYDWAYITVEVVPAGAPLDANADAGNLGGYEGTVDEPIQLQGSAYGGLAPYSYRWDLGNGETTKEKNPVVVYHEPGTYTVTLTVTDWNGDHVTDTSEVTVYDIEELLVSISGNTKAAQGDSIKFTSTVTGGKGPYAYNWDFGDGIISNQVNPAHIYENSGIYTVTLTVTDQLNNEKTKTKTITISSTETSEVEIKDVKGGLLLKATIVSDTEVSWNIDVQGKVFFGGAAQGTAQGVTQVKLPFTLAFGNVDIAITAGTEVKEYTAFAFGPLFFGLHEA